MMQTNKPETFKAFVTGSYAYGIPDEDKSDIDLVVLVSEKDAERLEKVAGDFDYRDVDDDYIKTFMVSLRFGKLNLLCCTDEEVYRAWKKGTLLLKKQAPVSRAFAVKFMKRIRQEAGL